MSKIYVLDTNIILHDYKSVRHFQDNDVVIPVAVIEELDKFKKGNDALAFNARSFMRDINKLTENKTFGPRGIPLGKNLGCIKIEPNHPFAPELQDLFKDDTQDHRILSTAMWMRDNNPGRFVALVTKDINLRLKAKAVGMEAQDYLRGRVDEEVMEGLEREVITVDVKEALAQHLAAPQDNALSWKEVQAKEPAANQLYKFLLGNDTICGRYDAVRKVIALVRSRQAYGIKPRNDEQKFALDACLNPSIPLVSWHLPGPWNRPTTSTRLFSPVPPWCWAVRISAFYPVTKSPKWALMCSRCLIIWMLSSVASNPAASRP